MGSVLSVPFHFSLPLVTPPGFPHTQGRKEGGGREGERHGEREGERETVSWEKESECFPSLFQFLKTTVPGTLWGLSLADSCPLGLLYLEGVQLAADLCLSRGWREAGRRRSTCPY